MLICLLEHGYSATLLTFCSPGCVATLKVTLSLFIYRILMSFLFIYFQFYGQTNVTTVPVQRLFSLTQSDLFPMDGISLSVNGRKIIVLREWQQD